MNKRYYSFYRGRERAPQSGRTSAMPDLKRALAAVLIFLACAPARAQQKTVRFNTPDGCRLEAFFLAPSSGSYILINAHGLGSSKNEWAPFQEELKKAGYGYLSLDLRGHNASRSCGGRETDYRYFSAADWNNASRDIEAAAAYLRKKGFAAKRIIFCGASVGANLSLKAAQEGRIKPAALVLLSPGLEYAGVKIEDYFLAPKTYRILTAASDNDPYAWRSSGLLTKAARAKNLRADFFDGGGGHGVNMFANHSLGPAILSWLSGL